MPRVVVGGRRGVLFLLMALLLLAGSAAAIGAWLVAAQARTAWDQATLERAVRFESDNAFYQYRLGQWEQFSLAEGDLQRSLVHYRRATELNPYESAYWLDLADALLLTGEAGAAEASVEKALQVDPHTPRTLWRVGQFWLRAGNSARAFSHFRIAVAADRSLLLPVIEACHRALGDPDVLLREVLPPQPDFLLTYLRYLVREGEASAAARVWKALATLDQRVEPQEVLFYLDYLLISARQPQQALKLWNDLERHHALSAKSVGGGQLLFNPDLRTPILDGGFDWRIERHPHVSVTLGPSRHGPQPPAIVIRFSGEDNLHYRHFYQYVVVEPNTRYRFQAWLSTEGITTDSGPRLEIADAYDPKMPVARSPDWRGTNAWGREEVDFLTGPRTRLLRVGIVRLPSRHLNNRIRGTVRAAEFSLKAVRSSS